MKNRIPGLDSIRALACIWVFAHHFSQKFMPADQYHGYLVATIRRGHLGVAIFFVLSGFLLSRPFWEAFHQRESMPSLRRYFAKRMVRIVPGYYICIVICTFLAFSDKGGSGDALLRSISALSFTNSFYPEYFFPVPGNPPLWSIGIEVLFYVMFPLLALAVFKCRTAAQARTLVVSTMFLITCLQLAWIRIAVISSNATYRHFWVITHNAVFLFSFFLVGVFASEISFVVGRCSKVTTTRYKIGFDVIALLLLVTLFGLDLASTIPGIWYAEKFGLPYLWPLYPMLVAALLLCLGNGRIGRLLDRKIMRLTATLSFGIYIWHFPIMQQFRNWFPRGDLSGSAVLICWFAALAMTFLCAAISFLVIERPAMVYVDARFRGGMTN